MDINFNLKILSFHRKIFIDKQWVRFGIIVTALLMAVIVSYWGSAITSFLLLFLLGGTAVMLVLLRQPNVGFIFLFLSALIPFEGPGHVNATALVVALLLGLWFLDMLVVKRSFQLVKSRVIVPVVVFLAISVLAFGMGQIPWFIFAHQAPLDAQAGGFAIFLLSAGALLLAAHLIKDERWLTIVVWSFIGICTIYMLGRAVGLSIIDLIYPHGLVAGSMLWTWLVALALAQAMFNTHLTTRVRVLLFVLVLLTLYVAIVQGYDWKSGWVPPLVSIAVLMSIRYRRLVFFAIPFALLVVAYAAGKLVGAEDYSWGTRVDAWLIVLEISRVSPLLGLGFANYYWYTPLFPIRGWRVSFNSHSQFVDLVAQVGIAGLLCFFWIFFEVGRLSWNLINRLPDGFARSYACGVLAGLAGSLMAAFLVDWILPFTYNIGFGGFRASVLPWLFFGGLVSIEQIYSGTTKS